MTEKLKSAGLVTLVLLSLLQTWLLVYRTPQFEQATRPDYVQTESVDQLQEIEQLLQPQFIVTHLSKQKYSVLYPEMVYFRRILEQWKERSYDGLRKSNVTLLQFYEQRATRAGIELQFFQEIQVDVLRTVMNLNVTDEQSSLSFDTLYGTLDSSGQDVTIWLISQKQRIIYEVVKNDWQGPAFIELTKIGEYQAKYRSYALRHFIPEEPLVLQRYRLTYEETTAAQLWQKLFINPSITRNLIDRDGTEIYTDGTRGLQVNEQQRYMIYSDPAAQIGNNVSVADELLVGIQFINQHGGWNGKYILQSLNRVEAEGEDQFFFRQYFGSYPIIELVEQRFGSTALRMKGGAVAGFERSMIRLGSEMVEQDQVVLPAGDELEALIKQTLPTVQMTAIYPVYVAEIDNESVQLTPMWAVEQRDGAMKLLPQEER
jgi:regulatory protein YycH of two-component signal transduction system YycFG